MKTINERLCGKGLKGNKFNHEHDKEEKNTPNC